MAFSKKLLKWFLMSGEISDELTTKWLKWFLMSCEVTDELTTKETEAKVQIQNNPRVSKVPRNVATLPRSPRADPGLVGKLMSDALEMLAKLVILEEGLARPKLPEPPIRAETPLEVPSKED